MHQTFVESLTFDPIHYPHKAFHVLKSECCLTYTQVQLLADINCIADVSIRLC